MATGQIEKVGDAGPAAGITWADTRATRCRVEWGDPSVTEGKIIYISQMVSWLHVVLRKSETASCTGTTGADA